MCMSQWKWNESYTKWNGFDCVGKWMVNRHGFRMGTYVPTKRKKNPIFFFAVFLPYRLTITAYGCSRLSIYLKVISMFSLTAITLHINTTTITLAYIIIIYHVPPYWPHWPYAILCIWRHFLQFSFHFFFTIYSGGLLTAE